MNSSEQNGDQLLAAISGGKAFVRVVGRGSFKVSATLKQFVEKIVSGKNISRIIIDVAECIGMDSTFMGVLAGLAGRLKKEDKELVLIRLDQKNANLLATLGLDRILSCHTAANGDLPEEADVNQLNTEANKKDLAKTALAAHEELSSLNEENRVRFKSVLEYLRADVNNL